MSWTMAAQVPFRIKCDSESVRPLFVDYTPLPFGRIRMHAYAVHRRGFQSSARGNTLAQTIVKADIAKNVSVNAVRPFSLIRHFTCPTETELKTQAFYPPPNWNFLNNTPFPATFDYADPSLPFHINGKSEPTTQRFLVRFLFVGLGVLRWVC